MTTQRMEPGMAQTTEGKVKSPNKNDRYVMPGLCPKLVWAFRRKRHVIPTIRTIAQNEEVDSGAVLVALIYNLYEKLEAIEAKFARRVA